MCVPVDITPDRSTAHTRRTNTESNEREEKREEKRTRKDSSKLALRHGSTPWYRTKKKRTHSDSALERKFLGIAVEEVEKAVSKSEQIQPMRAHIKGSNLQKQR